jgi:HSP20 family protein
MAIKNLITRSGGSKQLPAIGRRDDPFSVMRREMDRMLEDFSRGFGLSPSREWGGGLWSANEPRVDVAETDKEIKVQAELPGLQEKDINVDISDNHLTLRGEKKSEEEEKGADFYFQERSYGAFERSIPLPVEVDKDKAEASFKNGVLSIRLPKTAEAQQKVRKIPVKTE